MNSMKAVRIHSYGGSDVLSYEDAPRPTPAAGEVLVRVAASSVNPFDCALHAGYMAAYFNHSLPLIPGTDISGTIEEVGSGVTSFKRGDEVYGRAGVSRDGSYAEYVVLPATDIALKPRSLDHSHAAALPHVTLTAWQALFEQGDLQPGQTVLIHAAAGGVGHVAVQLAKWRGAKVIGTASRNIEFIRELGVDQAIDYSTTAFEDVTHDVDLVLDTMGGDTQQRSWGVLKKGGMLVSTVQPPSQEMADSLGMRQGMVSSNPPIDKTLTEVNRLVESGTIKPHVSATLPLKDIQQAHTMLEGKHTRGKITINVAP
jgi:NADPH:quinone reductase-like Zn-dependent oxidoreductase